MLELTLFVLSLCPPQSPSCVVARLAERSVLLCGGRVSVHTDGRETVVHEGGRLVVRLPSGWVRL